MSASSNKTAFFDKKILRGALINTFRKLSPRIQLRNPVMFIVYVGSIMTTALLVQALTGHGEASVRFIFWVTVWLWLTVLFANFSEAVAEGRGKAQAESLRVLTRDTMARKQSFPRKDSPSMEVVASSLRKGDTFLVNAGEIIPADGEIIDGMATVDESAITGESAPVIRESGGDRSAVTGGSRVLSDWLLVKVTADPGESFLDRMIGLVEGARRQKTPNEIALTVFLAALTLVFLVVCMTLLPFSIYSVLSAGHGSPVTVTTLVALLVCLIPTTIGALLSAIGIAGIDRLTRFNVIALSGRAVEAAGDVDVLLLDKTGTITLGNREAVAFVPAPGIDARTLADAAQLSSLADETPEGRSIVVLAKEEYGIRERTFHGHSATFVKFAAKTRMSGVDTEGRVIRKGASQAIAAHVESLGGSVPEEVRKEVERISQSGGTPLVVSDGPRILGVVHLKDIVKGGIKTVLKQCIVEILFPKFLPEMLHRIELRRIGRKEDQPDIVRCDAIPHHSGREGYFLSCVRSQRSGRDPMLTAASNKLIGNAASGDGHRMRTSLIGYPVEGRKTIGQDLTVRIQSAACSVFYGGTGKSFRSLLGIAGDVTAPTYDELYAAKSRPTISSGCV